MNYKPWSQNGKYQVMEVLILSRKPEIFSTRRLAEEILALGHQPLVLDPEDPDLTKARPAVVIPRFGTWRFPESIKALDFFARRKVPVLNTPMALQEARNKWISYLMLREEGLPVPDTLTAFKKNLPKKFPYVAKALEGAKGDGVFLIKGPAELLALPEGEWLIQNFVSEARGKDHRLLVLGGQVIAAMTRTAAKGDFRSNLSAGGRAALLQPSKLECDLALHATKALRLNFAGVDLMTSNKGPLVLEVNGSPGLEGIESVSGQNLARRIAEFAISLQRQDK